MAQKNRYFELVNGSYKSKGEVYKGKSPSQAARKAATRGHKKILLRERGTKKIREYKGSYRLVTLKVDTSWASAGDRLKQSKAKFVRVVR